MLGDPNLEEFQLDSTDIKAHLVALTGRRPPEQDRGGGHKTPPRKQSWWLISKSHIIDRFFCHINRYRRVATRHKKKVINFLGFVWLTALMVELI